jgi:hypothetical protein
LQARDSGSAAPRQGGALAKLRLREMELLLAIHEHKSITSAATQLGFTQPAASRALATWSSCCAFTCSNVTASTE